MQLETALRPKKLLDNFVYILIRAILVSVFFIYALLLVLSNFNYIEPYLYMLHIAQGNVTVISKNVVVGPYPHREQLVELKEQYKIDTVISLLDPSLPQERALLDKEKESAHDLRDSLTHLTNYAMVCQKGARNGSETEMFTQII